MRGRSLECKIIILIKTPQTFLLHLAFFCILAFLVFFFGNYFLHFFTFEFLQCKREIYNFSNLIFLHFFFAFMPFFYTLAFFPRIVRFNMQKRHVVYVTWDIKAKQKSKRMCFLFALNSFFA